MTDRRRSRAWVLFFAALLLLAGTAISLEVWFSLHQQLTRESLERARALWREKGPEDYDLKYTMKRQSRARDRLQARVRGGAVEAVEANGAPLPPRLFPFYDLAPLFAEVDPSPGDRSGGRDGDVSCLSPEQSRVTYLVQVRHARVVRAAADDRPLPAEAAPSYGMPGLFAGVGEWLEEDESAGARRPYAVAVFDRADGHLLHYVRSLMRTGERVEFNLADLQRVPAQAPSAR
jgi:hypothetical protein